MKSQEMQRQLWLVYTATQGAYKNVKKMNDSLAPAKAAGVDELLRDFGEK